MLQCYSDICQIRDQTQVGFVLVRNEEIIFIGKFSMLREKGDHPEDKAILRIKENILGIDQFYTDYPLTKYGTCVGRKNKYIKLCHKVAKYINPYLYRNTVYP